MCKHPPVLLIQHVCYKGTLLGLLSHDWTISNSIGPGLAMSPNAALLLQQASLSFVAGFL